MLECVVNVAEGRSPHRCSGLATSAGASLRDVHSDAQHHRSVFTLIGTATPLASDVRSLAAEVFATLDLTGHRGVHPRLGVLDVVPFVALDATPSVVAVDLRDETARWIAESHDVPVFLYGPLPDGTTRTLPEIRRRAFADLAPDLGPHAPHPRWGASCVGARPVLVAWNLWVSGTSLDDARRIAAGLRRPGLRSLAFPYRDGVQVSCTVTDVGAVRLSEVFDAVLGRLPRGAAITTAELVGLAPRAVLDAEDQHRWAELGLSEDRTIEARLAA